MPSLNMNGPHDFTSLKIGEVVTRKSAGNYALGYISRDGSFVVQYVGRSDVDVKQELRVRLSISAYQAFKFSYASSPKAAFEKECRNYHDFGGKQKLDNDNHPDRPTNCNWKCPVCKVFGSVPSVSSW